MSMTDPKEHATWWRILLGFPHGEKDPDLCRRRAFRHRGGFALGIFVYPYIFLSDIIASEGVASPASKTLVAKGTFTHANPLEPIHRGRGSVTLYSDLLHLESDFEVGPGPKFHVYLVPE